MIDCENDAFGTLAFVPDLACRLHGLMLHPKYGNCSPRSMACVLNTPTDDVRKKIIGAFEQAAVDKHALILYFLGHGYFGEQSERFYLMPTGERANTGIDLEALITQQLDTSTVRGLTVIIDACYSGTVLRGMAEKWVNRINFTCVASVASGNSYNGDFSRAFAMLMENGIDGYSEPFLDAPRLGDEIAKVVLTQERPSIAIGRRAGGQAPYISKNPRISAVADIASEGRSLPESFQATRYLAKIIDASSRSPVVQVIGGFGSGKSTLARALPTRLEEMAMCRPALQMQPHF